MSTFKMAEKGIVTRMSNNIPRLNNSQNRTNLGLPITVQHNTPCKIISTFFSRQIVNIKVFDAIVLKNFVATCVNKK